MADQDREDEAIMKLYRHNNPHLAWEATSDELAEQFWHGSRQAGWLTREGGSPVRETAGAVSAWLRDPLAHESSWDDRQGFNEVVDAVLRAWPLAPRDADGELTEDEIGDMTAPQP
jgi:hypothetical protein